MDRLLQKIVKFLTIKGKNYEFKNLSDFIIVIFRLYPPSIQMVHKRARQFESGKPENDPQLSDRTLYFKSEIARFSSKKIVPNVTERAQEFETRSEPTNRETPSTIITPKKIQRDSRSLDSNGKLVES